MVKHRVPHILELGVLLREWRRRRGVSQLDLAHAAGLSQRHVSFVETGRSTPARETLSKIAEALDVPFRERNALFLAAGFAPPYKEGHLAGEDMGGIIRALERTLRQHEPFPAFVLDRLWNVLLANDAARQFFNMFFHLDAHPKPRNILRLMFDPKAMRPHIDKWETVAPSLIGRVRRETPGHVVDEPSQALIASLLAYPDVKPEWAGSSAFEIAPLVPIGFIHDKDVLNYFSLISTIGTPQTILSQELRVECMFPSDETTEAHHIALMSDDFGRKKTSV